MYLDAGPQRGAGVGVSGVTAADGEVEAVEGPEADDGDDAATIRRRDGLVISVFIVHDTCSNGVEL